MFPPICDRFEGDNRRSFINLTACRLFLALKEKPADRRQRALDFYRVYSQSTGTSMMTVDGVGTAVILDSRCRRTNTGFS